MERDHKIDFGSFLAKNNHSHNLHFTFLLYRKKGKNIFTKHFYKTNSVKIGAKYKETSKNN